MTVATVSDPASPNHAAGARLDFVDVLRLIAATAVLVQHVFEISPIPALRWIPDTFSPGVFGVALFFLVSGFVMPLSVRGGFDPRAFLLRRLFRIYPGVLFAFLLWATFNLAVGGPNNPLSTSTSAQWIANLLLVQDFVGQPALLGVTWTLILEVIWYAMFAASLFLWQRRGLDLLAWFVPTTIVVLMIASLASGYRLPFGRIGMIYAAVVGMQSYRRLDGEISDRRFAVDASLFVVLIAATNYLAFGYFHHPNITLANALWPWLGAQTLFLLTQIAAVRRSKLFENRSLAWLGAVSFSLYLLHPIAAELCATLAPEIIRMPLTVGLAFGLAIAGYYAVERPGIALGRILVSRSAKRIAVEAF